MSDMDERIERAARALGGPWFGPTTRHYATDDHEVLISNYPGQTAANQERCRKEARAAIAAAFPELFDGTAWVAPTKATIGVYRPLLGRLKDFYEKTDNQPGLEFITHWLLGGFAEDWASLRDAHIKGQETDSKVEG
jgi:hypothetical protein